MKRILLLLLVSLLATVTVCAAEYGKTTVDLDAREAGAQATTFGAFLTDAMRTAAGSNVALAHTMTFRADAHISTGVVDEQALRASLAFPTSKIVVLKLTPAQLRAVMERALSRYPERNSAFLQFSGMTVKFDSAQPAKTRVIEIRIADKAIDFSDNKTTFTVAMPSQLASGGGGYYTNFSEDVMKTADFKELTLLDAVAQEFKRLKGTITPDPAGRLTDISAKKK